MSTDEFAYQRRLHFRGLANPKWVPEIFEKLVSKDAPKFEYLLNWKLIDHWALEVDSTYYEIAEPRSAENRRALILLEEKVSFEAQAQANSKLELSDSAAKTTNSLLAKMKVQNGYGSTVKDEKDPSELESAQALLNILEKEVDEESRKLVFANPVHVPLQVSKGVEWDHVKGTLTGTKTLEMRGTNVPPETVLRRANHIYDAAFDNNYHALTYNCQAFVMYLSFSLDLLDGTRIGCDSRVFNLVESKLQAKGAGGKLHSATDTTHIAASLLIYQGWKAALGESCPKLGISWKHNQKKRSWSEYCLEESSIDYRKLIPPSIVDQLLKERNTKPPPQRKSHILPPEPVSHASHLNEQAHHATLLDLQNVINNAVLVQQQVMQQQPTGHSSHGGGRHHGSSHHSVGHHSSGRHGGSHHSGNAHRDAATNINNIIFFSNPAMNPGI